MNENTNTVNSLTDTAIDTAIRLSDTAISTALPKDKPYKLQDGLGMHVKVMPNGSKYFRLDYRLNGKRQTLALGVYPETSLEQAREARDSARKQIKNGIKPRIKDKQPNSEAPKKMSSCEEHEQGRSEAHAQGVRAAIEAFSRKKVSWHSEAQCIKSETNVQNDVGGTLAHISDQSAVQTQIDTAKNLERQLQEKDQEITTLKCHLGSLKAFIGLTKDQQAMLFTPDHPALIKLKELEALRVNTRISDRADNELIDELKRRGYSVTQICNETV